MVIPVTIIDPPTLAFDTIDKPVPDALLNVNVSDISAVLFKSNALFNVVASVTVNVPVTLLFPPIFKFLPIPTPPLIISAPVLCVVEFVVEVILVKTGALIKN